MFRTALISLFVTSAALAGSHVVQVNNVGEGWVDSISNTGVAAGANSGANQYFMWTPKNGNQFIGGVSPGSGVGGRAGVSDQGAYINGSVFNALSGHHEAAVYDVQSGTWTPLGGIGGSSGSEISSGWGISGDGSTIVGLAWEDAGTAYATTWSLKGEATSLGTSVPGSSTRANNTNEDGSVVVGWQDADYRRGAVWVDGKQELIYRPDGDPAFEAYSVSGDGQWVTGLGIGPFSGVGDTYRYNSFTDVCEVIPNLATGGGRSMAGAAIAEDGGTIVGGTWGFGVPASFGDAFIWREGVGTMPLADYFEEVGVTWPVGFHFAFATSISPNGKWIAGWGNSGGPGNTVSWFVEIPGNTTWTVDDDGKADFDNIQDAIDAASDGDEIVVMEGMYYEHDINTLGKSILIEGSINTAGELLAVVHGNWQGSVFVCDSGETTSTVLKNLLITGGNALSGSGMYIEESSPSLVGCTFMNNYAIKGFGGGMCNISNSSPTLTNCTFTGNAAGGSGGGMYNDYSSPTLTNCTFTNNTTVGKGGGMYNSLFSFPILTNCAFTDNTANYGGGMFNDDSSPTLTGCTFTDNTANDGGGGVRNVDNAGLGGGMHNYNSDPTLTDCTFTNNTTDGKGGGMYNYLFSSPTLANCTFTYNTTVDGGGGMYNYVDSSPHLIDCIFENNIANGKGGGMLNIINSNPTLTDTTVCGNTPDQIIGDWIDNGGNTIADECPIDCPDINGDGYVNVTDLLVVIDQWGSTDSPADLNQDGIVDVTDLLIVVGNWGPCP